MDRKRAGANPNPNRLGGKGERLETIKGKTKKIPKLKQIGTTILNLLHFYKSAMQFIMYVAKSDLKNIKEKIIY